MTATEEFLNILDKYLDEFWNKMPYSKKVAKRFIEHFRKYADSGFNFMLGQIENFFKENKDLYYLMNESANIELTIIIQKNFFEIRKEFKKGFNIYIDWEEPIPDSWLRALEDIIATLFSEFSGDMTGIYLFDKWNVKRWLDTIYKHYKGNYYKVISDKAILEKDFSRMVVYEDIFTKKIWIRPYDEFFETIDEKPRFEKILKEGENGTL